MIFLISEIRANRPMGKSILYLILEFDYLSRDCYSKRLKKLMSSYAFSMPIEFPFLTSYGTDDWV